MTRILLLLLGLACQTSDEDIEKVVEERIVAALAAVPTVTPQPTTTPRVASQPISTDQLEASIESLIDRLAAAESKLLAQDERLGELSSLVGAADVGLPDPRMGAIVFTAVESSVGGVCWLYRAENGGKGNLFLIEWEQDGETNGLCYHPSSTCVEEVQIGAVLPDSCLG